MSAFIVEHACISRVVLALRSGRPEYLRVDPDSLGMMLLDMNRRAVVARYGDNSVEAIEPYRYIEPMGGHPHLLVQVYKSLRCYLYQCSEGDVPDQPLYLQLDAVRNDMACALGHKGETWKRAEIKAVYDACEWG